MTWPFKVAEELIEKAAWAVTSADKAYHWLREQGYDVRRADVRAAWREYNLKTLYEGPISQWDPGKKIPKAWIVERESKEATDYMYALKYQLVDPETGEKETRWWAYRTPDLISFSDVEPEAQTDALTYAMLEHKVVDWIRPAGVIRFAPKD